jgi:flagellar M-ring protein FliF
MQPGAVLAPEQARSLISLVAHGVEGLTEEHVTVLDTEGRLLSPHRGPSTEVLAQLDYQTRFEMGLAAKAETMLEQMLGPGRATVRVTADIDFTDIKRTETRYDPDSEVKKNETVTSITQSGSPRPAAGIPGTASNLTPPTPAASGEGAYKEEHTSTDFENAKIDETVHELPGKLQRLTVAAIVDLPAETTEGTTAGPTAQDVEAIIQRAVGFDSTRSDEIQVVIAPLETSRQLEQDLLTATTWERYAQLVTSASLGIAAVVALAVTLLILRRLRPIVIPTEGPRQFTPEQLNKVIEISQLAQENSTVAAEVLKAWINEHSESHSDDEIPRSSARRAA